MWIISATVPLICSSTTITDTNTVTNSKQIQTLVLLDQMQYQSTHSIFFQQLTGEQQHTNILLLLIHLVY
jgi:hypothetical protein